uniref:Uncharacterized protein n=1 Tax=Daphnia magna TaxID=35525 RepID=A0A0P4YN54_9CRUS
MVRRRMTNRVPLQNRSLPHEQNCCKQESSSSSAEQKMHGFNVQRNGTWEASLRRLHSFGALQKKPEPRPACDFENSEYYSF